MKLAILCLTLALAFQPAFAKSPKHTNVASQAATAPSDDLIEQGSYVNKAGNTVHSPAHTKSGKAPEGATAKCGDGTFSFSQSHRGTCSHHGGVVAWL
ncbi:DUF3761 domain-containing protein [Silvimonas iriomotensis]|uniref:DUF3761 domain-containing protein n=1 Tax=Silvimonas iriomotensis TaxID=449662 RepID=A0ABQ2P420_9NEIS|nr:hypothetical protein GCM10010970_01500 [Silvimonas iriomotensis]